MKIDFYFDFISPYAYLAWPQVRELSQRRGHILNPIPVLFAGLLNHHGQLGPAEIPTKRIYTFKHVFRLAARHSLPLVPPPSHPFNPLLALRVCGLDVLDQKTQASIITALFDATWATGSGIDTVEKVVATLDGAGHAGSNLVEMASTQQAKDKLRKQTEVAIARGVFGVPTMLVDDELFWGQEAVVDVENYCQGEDPCQSAEWASWLQIGASAERSRKS